MTLGAPLELLTTVPFSGCVQPVHLCTDIWMVAVRWVRGAEMTVLKTDHPTPEVTCPSLFLQTRHHSLGGVKRGFLEGVGGGLEGEGPLASGKDTQFFFLPFLKIY